MPDEIDELEELEALQRSLNDARRQRLEFLETHVLPPPSRRLRTRWWVRRWVRRRVAGVRGRFADIARRLGGDY